MGGNKAEAAEGGNLCAIFINTRALGGRFKQEQFKYGKERSGQMPRLEGGKPEDRASATESGWPMCGNRLRWQGCEKRGCDWNPSSTSEEGNRQVSAISSNSSKSRKSSRKSGLTAGNLAQAFHYQTDANQNTSSLALLREKADCSAI